MSFGIYKPEQGYWTRVMTAVGIGVISLAGAMWLWQQLGRLEASYPVSFKYIQAGAAGVIVLFAGLLTYWIVGVKPRTVEFFVATEGEMQKVNWSSRKEVMGSTWVVISVSFIIAAVLFITDIGFSRFFQAIDVLKR